MNVLIIGGTKFVGRHIAQAFLNAGARVALFNRGNTYGDPVLGVEQIHGDRNRDLRRLGDRAWDAVIDTSAYVPREAEIAARYFAGRAGRYVFVSTLSVYDVPSSGRLDEEAPVDRLAESADRTRMVPETYGALKALCENVIVSTFRDRATVLRPGLVAGPYDPTDRFTYWPLRLAAGGRILLPHNAEHPIQYIDARDLAAFTVSLVRANRGGTFNVVTTPGTVTFGDLFEAALTAARRSATAVYFDEQRLLDEGVQPWSDLPLWVPSTAPDLAAFVRAPNSRARNAGLQLRPVRETVRDVLAWARRSGKRLGHLGAGLAPPHESRLLSA